MRIQKFIILTLSWIIFSALSARAQLSPTQLRCEYLVNPHVVDVANPRLSWVNVAREGERGQIQTAWEIQVASTKEKLANNQGDLWSSGKVTSDQSFNVRYAGKALPSRQHCWWRVRTWDKNGNVSDWSEPAS